MPTIQMKRNPIAAARRVVDHATRLVKLNVELRTTDLKPRATKLGIGVGLGVVALLLSPLLVLFLLAVIAAALATTLPVWLSILIVAAILLLVIGGLGGAAALLTMRALKGDDDGKR